ncbi:uncharacterized protein METZ01_LOCUS68051 [marine metagenome]|uniref:TonB-dependent receptor plug domain-containing protein n=1 Tax=marine metagenome TaxID=408172 RepID=A0A381TK89_9ZZZZ
MKKYFFLLILLSSSSIFAQAGSIKGTITDRDDGDPLIGANIIIEGTTMGAATDVEGRYQIINVPAGEHVLKVTYIGYEDQQKPISIEPEQELIADFSLLSEAIQMQTYVVTASRKRERVEDAPAAISVITEVDIRRESNTNLGDYMKTVKGVEFTQSGIDSYNLSARGFNTSFSSRLLTLTDGRMANVPSLRLIAYNVIPVSFEDVKQIEVVLGPSSALYGPNAYTGVLNIITSSPLDASGTSINIQGGILSQKDSDPMQKYTMRHAFNFKDLRLGGMNLGDFGFKVSGVVFRGEDWHHYNPDEFRGHDPAFIGRPYLANNGIDDGSTLGEFGNPEFTAEMLDVWEGSEDYWVGRRFADGIDGSFGDGESGSPLITQEMIDAAADDPFHRYTLPNGIVLWGVTIARLNKKYSDGIDNNNNGLIDEKIDSGIDDATEIWYDRVDNDGDGEIDEQDEIGTSWTDRIGSTAGDYGLGEYEYTEDGRIIFDSNGDGLFDGEDDFKMNYGGLSTIIKDANNDGIDDFPDFDVQNYRYDIRADWQINPDLSLSVSRGWAKARNINITGIARYLADGWQYNYVHGRIVYKSWFLQAYLNTTYSGDYDPRYPLAYSPTRNLATGGTIYDRSKKFSTQIQQSNEFMNGNLRFVWGIDYFMTMPDTRGTILRDNNLNDRRDNDGDGEAGSPDSFYDRNDNTWYDYGEQYTSWASIDTTSEGVPIDNVIFAVKDGIDNDGDGLIDEGIDEDDENNRRIVNELGAYYQVNWKLSDKFELVQATRLDVHDRLTDMVRFNNEQGRNINFLNWEYNFDNTEGLQISPKVGLIYRPKENQTFRLTWAQAFNTPTNQALFLDIFVTRVAIFKVYARGADGGYVYPRNEQGDPFFYNINSFTYMPMDTSRYILFYPSVDPKIKGFYNYTTNDLPEIEAEVIDTWEFGWKGRISRKIFGTLDIYTNHFGNFISRPTFITPIVINKSVLETDWNGDGIINNVVDITDNNIIADPADYDKSFEKWVDNIEGVTAMDTIKGLAPPIVVGYLNYGEVDVNGIDASITYFITRDLSFNLHYSYLSISDFLNPVTNSKDPINAPKNKGGFKLQYDPQDKPYSFSLNFRHVDGFPWSSGVYYGQINSYNIFDLHTDYEINDNLSAMLTLNNMLDHMHTEIQGGPQLGRVIMFRLQAKF